MLEPPVAGPVLRSPQAADAIVLAAIQEHAGALLGTARRHSYCADDAKDAYQRGLEIFMRHAMRLDAEKAHRWLRRVIRNEAVALRESRRRIVGPRRSTSTASRASTRRRPRTAC